MRLEIPIFLPSAANLREHHFRRHERVKSQRKAVHYLWRSALVHNDCPGPPVTVTLTRVAPRKIRDRHDNLRSAFKGIVDQVAAELGVDDGDDQRVTWRYAQAVGEPMVVIDVEPRLSNFESAVGGNP